MLDTEPTLGIYLNVMDARALGARIRKLRLEQAEPLTQETLAALLGVDQATISCWERGVKRPSISNIVPLAKVLGTTVDTLLSGEPTAA